jgi:lipoprotein-anchoring transpeptidase ErfK/SrfK
VDATVSVAGGNIDRKPSREGRAVLANRLRRDVMNAMTGAHANRDLRIRTRKVKPKVTSDDLGERYPAVLIVNRDAFRLTLYKNLKPAKTYRIAVGQAGMDTPAGEYKIENKAENPAWHVPDSDWAGELRGKIIPPDDPRNPIEARWMAIYNGAGIHGTEAIASLGTRASHGCVRMAIPDVIELYDQVPVGSPVVIL